MADLRRRCERDDVPQALHLKCWACRRLVGPGHPCEELRRGLCDRCENLLRWVLNPAARHPGDMADDGPGDLVDLRTAATRSGLSVSTIRKRAKAGHYPLYARPGPSGSPHGQRLYVSLADVARPPVLVAAVPSAPSPPNPAQVVVSAE